MTSHITIATVAVLVITAACTSACRHHVKNQTQQVSQVAAGTGEVDLSVRVADTSLVLDFEGNAIPVRIEAPTVAPRGAILVLHGWNLPATDWCTRTSLCDKAHRLGYWLIIPDFGRSNYTLQHYTETRKDWRKYPTRRWMLNAFIPHLQKGLQLLLPGQRNFVMGLSTGGRGAALLGIEAAGVFKGIASLSGDFDQTKFAGNGLYTGFYGPIARFPERWGGEENLLPKAARLTVPMYLGHGMKDRVVPCAQSQDFHAAVKHAHPDVLITLHLDEKGAHDHAYWSSEVDAVLRFFDDIK